MTYREPRPLAHALANVVAGAAPATTLALVQQYWEEAVGKTIAEEATPVSERSGTVTVACRSAVWASELELMSKGLVEGVNSALGGQAVASLRFVVKGSAGK